MPRYPSQIPNAHVAYTAHATTPLPAGTVAVQLNVTSAGTIEIEDQFGTTLSPAFAVGTHVYPMAKCKRVGTGGGATFTVHALVQHPEE